MKRSRLIPAALGLLLLLAACGADDSTAQTFPAGGAVTDTDGGFDYAATTTIPGLPPDDGGAAPEAPGTDAEETAPLAALGLARMIIFTATIQVEVEDITTANTEVIAAITPLGGVVFGQETTTGESPRTVLTIKIAPENFDRALERLGGIGDLLSQTIYADDVTERVVDIESRITTAEASVIRLRALLESAPGIEEVVAIESELLRRETDLEVMRGQLRTLEDQVALATIVVILTEPTPENPEVEVVQTIAAEHEGGANCPGRDEIEVDEGAPITVCFVVTNTGDSGLTDIVVTDSGLRLDPHDVIVVEGSLEATLLPGERLVLAYEIEAEFDRPVSPGFSAVAVNENDEPLYYEVTAEIEAVELIVIEDTSLPGFADSLDAAWNGMRWIFGVAVMLAGAAVPFLWVPLLLGAAWWWRRRRHPAAPTE